MEPVTMAIIATATFGAVTALTVFVRQLLLSRDKNLNDKAHRRALSQETHELEKIRSEMASSKRFDSHYQVLGANKDAIQYLDQKIDEILNKKFELIQRYATLAVKESTEIVDGKPVAERKALCDLLRDEIKQEIQFYDSELEQLQKRRASIWESHSELQEYLLAQETDRNDKLDSLFQRHTSMLEKIYLRHHEESEQTNAKVIDAGTESIRIMTAPLQFLLKLFKPSTGISRSRAREELDSRSEVARAEQDLNEELRPENEQVEKEPEMDLTI